MPLETVTLKLPQTLLSDASRVASAQDVTIGHLVRQLLAKEVERRLNPKTPNRADEGLLAALQALLAKDIAEAADWHDLDTRLRPHGYCFRPAGGGIALHKTSCGSKLCKGSELGFSYLTLLRRFGCAMPGHPHGTLGENLARDETQYHHLNSTQKGRAQRALTPLFKTSTDWHTLKARLADVGYLLKPQGTGLAIYRKKDGRYLCNTATVGYRYRALVKKMGAPMPGHKHGANWVRSRDTSAQQIEEPELDFDVIDSEERERSSATQNAPI